MMTALKSVPTTTKVEVKVKIVFEDTVEVQNMFPVNVEVKIMSKLRLTIKIRVYIEVEKIILGWYITLEGDISRMKTLHKWVIKWEDNCFGGAIGEIDCCGETSVMVDCSGGDVCNLSVCFV